MFADALNPIIAKKNMKKNWKINGKIIYLKKLLQTIDHSNEGEITEIKEIIKMKKNN